MMIYYRTVTTSISQESTILASISYVYDTGLCPTLLVTLEDEKAPLGRLYPTQRLPSELSLWRYSRRIKALLEAGNGGVGVFLGLCNLPVDFLPSMLVTFLRGIFLLRQFRLCPSPLPCELLLPFLLTDACASELEVSGVQCVLVL